MGSESLSGSIAVVGTGVIGASWAGYFLAKGFDVAATDPADGAEKRLRTLVDGFWPALDQFGLAARSRPRLYGGASCASRDCRSLLMVLSGTGLRSSEA